MLEGQTEDLSSFPDSGPVGIYKEAVVIGNGPSAIATSYMLSGNWPYYNGDGHSIEFLHYRLLENIDKSIVEQDIEFLCDGLEGRSRNPVSVLFDQLHHPDADLGISAPSVLNWIHHPDKALNHVVLGKGLPGGSWQSMEGGTLTISLGSWMELPNLSYKDWEGSRPRERSVSAGMKQNRATVHSVAQYYQDYVRTNELDQYFHDFSFVTSVKEVESAKDSVSDEIKENKLWEVKGYKSEPEGSVPFRYLTPHVILATGSYDQPNRLCVIGENLPYIVHSLAKLEDLILKRKFEANSDPLLIVGAGLSAADAIIAAHFYGIPVVHVFRRHVTDPNLIFNQLPENMYPEYHKVYQMMQGEGAGYRGYRAYPRHQVMKFTSDHKVCIQGPSSSKVFLVSHALVLVGSRPDLSFLPNNGQTLGNKSGNPISPRNNPICIDMYTHESANTSGFYALGPLVGDNFVRFTQGGALAITKHLHEKNAIDESAEQR